MKHVPLLSVATFLALAAAVFTQEGASTTAIPRPDVAGRARSPGVRELAALLQETIDLDGFHKTQTLKEALVLLQDRLKLRGRELPIFVDGNAFKEENPEAASIYDTQIEFPVVPRQMNVAKVLHFMLSRVDPPNAALLIRPGFLEVTTIDHADIRRRLGEAVHASFDRRPLALALEELYQRTGVPIVVDPRAARQMKLPISADFTTSPSLGGVLLVLSEMAGLKMLVGDNMIYITTPAHARELLRERMWIPFQMQAGGPGSNMGYLGARQKRVE